MPPTLMEEMLYKYAHPVHSVKSPYETCNAGLESLQTAELEKVPGVGGTRRALQALHSHRLPLAQRPVPTEHLQGFTATQKPCPGSRPLLGTEQCHGGDNGLCLAGCENIRCAGSTAAESSLNEKSD
ncbi:uncharacterized protein LOC143273316 isoform X4 [Peromyscus maniculatus bairdii]|uniref:uncharacterized protein LOC143273316 isoform X4 n=1 Tax=Peromyscus maniculatus bairdii TaxID=230844 RepID=UPI003FD3451B